MTAPQPDNGRRPRLSVLLLCDDRSDHANTVLDHISALRTHSRHRVRTFNPTGWKEPWPIDFGEFDAVVIHYSLVCSSEYYLNSAIRQRLGQYKGLKVQFIQDEYRWINETTDAMKQMGIDVLFTCIPEPEAERIYGSRVDAIRIPTLTGYVPDNLTGLRLLPPGERPIDIGYRAREIPYWLGAFGQEKLRIATEMLLRADRYGLRCDINCKESERIYGRQWVQFLSSCRATLGTGSGASIADYDGGVQRSVEQYLQFKREASFEDVRRDVLQPFEGSLDLNVISPRIFEGIALRTALILFPAPYSGVIREWEHYIPLQNDFSNIDEVVEKLRDDQFVSEMTERAYADVIATGKYSYRQLASVFDDTLQRLAKHRPRLQRTYSVLVLQRRFKAMRVSHRMAGAWDAVKHLVPFPAPLGRLLSDPGEFTFKGYLALRAAGRSRASLGFLARNLFLGKPDGASIDAALDDVLKLDILRQSRESRLTAGVSFKAWPHLAGNGVLEMRSLPAESVDLAAAAAQDVLAAIQSGDVRSLVWDHSAVAPHVYHALTRRRWIMLWVGAGGIHDFPVITRLLAEDPRSVASLMRPVLGLVKAQAAPEGKPSRLIHRGRLVLHPIRVRLRVPAPVRRAAGHPIWYWRRSLIAARAVAKRPPYRGLLVRYAFDRHLRRRVSIDAVLEDLVKLDLLTDACSSANGYRVELRAGEGADGWRYTSTEGHSERATVFPNSDVLSRAGELVICWDHSAVSPTVEVPLRSGRRQTIFLGTAGVHQFSALESLYARVPQMITSLLPVPNAPAASIVDRVESALPEPAVL